MAASISTKIGRAPIAEIAATVAVTVFATVATLLVQFRSARAAGPYAGPLVDAHSHLKLDQSSPGIADLIGLYKKWAAEDKLNVRTYCINGVGMGNTAEQIDRALPRIAEMKLFQGDNYVDDIFYGESVYGPLHDPMLIKKSDPKPEQLALWRKIATEIAKDHLPLHVGR